MTMGCCCQGLTIVGLPDDVPDPPPFCNLVSRIGLHTAARTGGSADATNSTTGPSQVANPAYPGDQSGWDIITAGHVTDVNDEAWSRFESNWEDGGNWLNRTLAFGPSFSGVISVERAVTLSNFPGLQYHYSSGCSAAYLEHRLLAVIPLVTPSDLDTPYPMSTLYGVTEVALRIIATLVGRFYDFPPANQEIAEEGIGWTSVQSTYSGAWSQWEVTWGLLDKTEISLVGLSGFEKAFTNILASDTDGWNDITPNSLATVNVSDIGSVTLFSQVNSSTDIDLSSLTSEDGDAAIALLIKVPGSSVIKQTTSLGGDGTDAVIYTLSDPFTTINSNDGYIRYERYEYFGPLIRTTPLVTGATQVYLILQIWGCIQSMILNVDIDPDGSDAIAEDRTKSATYLSGTGLGKKFRMNDNGSVTYPTCNLVPISRIYHLDNPLANWTVSIADSCREGVFNTILAEYDLHHDDGVAGCHWKQYDSTVDCSPALTGEVDWDLAITINSGNPNLVDMTLPVTLYATLAGVFPRESHTIVYTLTGQSKTSTGPFTLTTSSSAAARKWTPGDHVGGTDFLTFPASFIVDTDPTPTTITRRADIYLDERVSGSGDGYGDPVRYYFLMIDYLRETAPNSNVYYVEKTFEIAEVGPGTSYETLGDLTGMEFPFSHDGDDNDDTGNGTEDVTIAFTIESISV